MFTHTHINTRQQGFSLIEMMVGITIGLLGLLAVTQVLITFNGDRTANTETMEAQNNGTMALYLLERDISQAGYGLTDIQDCSTINWYQSGTVQTPLSTLPVKITDGGAGSDSIAIQYASSANGVPTTQVSQSQLAYTDDITVSTIVGYTVNDLIVADVGGSCTLYQISAINNVSSALVHASNTYNPGAAPVAAGWDMIRVSDKLANLGNFVSKAYSVGSSNLMLGAFPAVSSTNDLVDGIVFMKAEYGRDTNNDGAVDAWVAASTWTPTNTTSKQVIAIRVGIVAQTTGKVAVNAPASFTVLPAIQDVGGSVIGAAVTYTPTDTSYRYKTYYTVIPMRNVIWSL